MLSKSILSLLVIGGCCFLPFLCHGQQSDSQQLAWNDRAKELETVLWNARKGIEQGKVQLTKRFVINKSQPILEKITERIDLYFSKDGLRQTRTEFFRDRESIFHSIVTPNQTLTYSGPKFPINVGRSNLLSRKEAKLFQPRTLGMFASEYAAYYALDDWFNYGGILCELNRVIELEILEGAERVSYQSLDPNSDDIITTYTFSTSQGCFPIEIRNESKKHNFRDEVLAVPQLVSQGIEKVYFPKSISYKRSKDDEVSVHERIEVDFCDFESPIPSDVFTIGALNLAIGSEALIDNQAMVPIRSDGTLDESSEFVKPQKSNRFSRFWFLATNASIAGFLALLLFWQKWTKKAE